MYLKKEKKLKSKNFTEFWCEIRLVVLLMNYADSKDSIMNKFILSTINSYTFIRNTKDRSLQVTF